MLESLRMLAIVLESTGGRWNRLLRYLQSRKVQLRP